MLLRRTKGYNDLHSRKGSTTKWSTGGGSITDYSLTRIAGGTASPKRLSLTDDSPLRGERRRKGGFSSSRHLLRLVTPATHLGSIRGDIAQLVELRSCNWVVAITGQKIHPGLSKEPSRPTTLISVGVFGISADLMVLGKSLNKVFTSFSRYIPISLAREMNYVHDGCWGPYH